ncbi:GlcG/HbpS family heme-binding protein [Deinococcus cellulosilyticus]|uniref:Heme-binding protein n=1 Tax=Deinococcus cellulosilyticus (strain DSM 18568 / NBRC 106333 / KACC 11606 / 5516J-15) TaxID=1223518 RepID=A0A511N1E9_DEIC1|nr:heme-binding protein [Deinococcus cellulosilyticus]GEM46156.1 hypothetical protein DC3_17910 [Deinococcus cellulosilyticus NBRC 106333 = KACC 11606]
MKHQLNLGDLEAQTAIQAIHQALVHRNQSAVIAVADSHGDLLALRRMDGAGLPSIQVATNKAYTAARLGEVTGDTGKASVTQGWSFSDYGELKYVGWDGGVPVWHQGQVVGAVAVSGLRPEEDRDLAEIGIQKHLEVEVLA